MTLKFSQGPSTWISFAPFVQVKVKLTQKVLLESPKNVSYAALLVVRVVSNNGQKKIVRLILPLDLSECPMRCKKTNDLKETLMKPIGKVIKNILHQLEVSCPNADCQQVMTLEKYEEHEYYCDLPKCQNIKCKKGSEKLISVMMTI